MTVYKILIVENDEDEQLFMRMGFDAVNAFSILAQLRNGDALVEWIEQHPDAEPDVILSDLNMPGRNGYDVLSYLRAHPRWSQVPVVITSTSSTQSIIDRCMAAGASGYMVKPDTFVNYEPFVHRLHDLVNKLRPVA